MYSSVTSFVSHFVWKVRRVVVYSWSSLAVLRSTIPSQLVQASAVD